MQSFIRPLSHLKPLKIFTQGAKVAVLYLQQSEGSHFVFPESSQELGDSRFLMNLPIISISSFRISLIPSEGLDFGIEDT